MLRHQADDLSEPAVLQPLPQFAEGRVETAAISDRQHDAGLARRFDRNLRACVIERDRLFHQNVFPGRCRLPYLLGMLAVGRREHDSIDIGIGQDRFEVVDLRSADDRFGAAHFSGCLLYTSRCV